jgi:nucleoside-diphosphate-sugar epimerase
VTKLVQVTALGTAENAANDYHATKWQAEQYIRDSGCRFVILRPSLIIGRQVGTRDSKLVARYLELIRTRPAVPVIGGGHNKIQPIFIGDLVRALEKAVCSDELDNQVYEIGGPEVLPMREFVARLIKMAGSNKPIRTVPIFAARLAAWFCQSTQEVPLVSSDQIKLSTTDNICAENSIGTTFGIAATAIDTALQTYSQRQSKEAAKV